MGEQFQFHPVAAIFPMMGGEAYRELVNDIREHGLREPIWLHEGQIIDGRNRYLACLECGAEPGFREWDGVGSLAAFVVSLNLHRRHLNESQRAMVAARLANMRQGERTDLLQTCEMFSQSQAAEALSVSPRSVSAAREVQEHGAPELAAAVDAGRVAVSTAAVLSEAPPEEQAQIVARGEREILSAAKEIRARKQEERRDERLQKIAETARREIPLGTVGARFPVVYADPPWRYEHAESDSRAIENQYPTMPLDAICALPVGDVATEDCILFLWATSPKLEEALRVVNAWGFTYRTCMVWVKDKIGMGYYARQQHELLLIATRGSIPPPPPEARPSSVLTAPRLEHSAKPEEAYALIERMYPDLPKLELFCRSPRDGWAVWGNEAERGN
jgi:N6-adenosine-specific RNA methylase IME4/ParB-like chromosome segregation protein Spo0J